MSLLSLPAVLVQSLMHWLDHTEIIAVARSCEVAMQSADSTFAWRDCPPIEFSFCAITPSILPSRLRLRAPMSLCLDFSCAAASDIDRILQFAASSRVVKVTMSIREFADKGAERLFSEPSAFRWLKEIEGLPPFSKEMIAAVAALPELTSVDLTGGSAIGPTLLDPLVGARQLRNLYVCDASNSSVSCLPALMQLKQLRMLCLYEPQLPADTFIAFCSAMSGLQELWLQSWDASLLGSEAVLAAGFRLLVSLRTLHCDSLSGYEVLLPVLPTLPALRRLVLLGMSFPSDLDALMRSAGNLHLELRAYQSEGDRSALVQKPSLAPFFDRVTIVLSDEQ